jgi:hypothetical protein
LIVPIVRRTVAPALPNPRSPNTLASSVDFMRKARLDPGFRPFAGREFIRLGKANDGGYLADRRAIESSDVLTSLGISDDWSFEADFVQDRPVPLHAFIGAIGLRILRWRFWKSLATANKPSLFFRRLKGLKGFQAFVAGDRRHHTAWVAGAFERSATLADILEEYVVGRNNNVCIKADVELNADRVLAFIERFPLKRVRCHPDRFSGVAPNGRAFCVAFLRPAGGRADGTGELAASARPAERCGIARRYHRVLGLIPVRPERRLVQRGSEDGNRSARA